MQSWEVLNIVKRMIAAGDLDNRLVDLSDSIADRRTVLKAKDEIRYQASKLFTRGEIVRIGVNHKRIALHGVTGVVNGTFGTLVNFKVSSIQDREIVRKEYPKSARSGAILVAAKCLEKLHA